MNLLIDSRELKIIDKFEQRNFPFRKEYLDLGDFIIQDSNQQELVIERKTWNDLQCSLKDQRYREQRSRLLLYEKNNNNVKICYILEGSNSDYEIEKKAVFRLIFAYQIPVFFSQNMEETVSLLTFMMNLPNLDCYFAKRNMEIDQVEARISCRLKKNYEDASLFFQEVLCFIKGMTSTISHEIGKEWSSIQEFVLDYEKDSIGWENKLQNVEYKTKQNNTKKINKNLIEKIKVNFNLMDSKMKSEL